MNTIATSVNFIQLSVVTQLHIHYNTIICLTVYPVNKQQYHMYRVQSACIGSKWGKSQLGSIPAFGVRKLKKRP